LRAEICLLLIAALLLSGAGMAQDNSGTTPAKSRKILSRSLLFPGWGQLLQKRYLPSAAFAAATASLLGVALYKNIRGNSSYRSYRQAGDGESASRFRELTLRCDRERNIALLAAAGVWALNLLDAWLAEKKRSRVNLGAEISDEKIALNLAFSF
jgi:hypothetical protein